LPAAAGLVQVPAPRAPPQDLDPDELESLVRSGMHRDRSPGTVLVVCHPLRMHKVPRGLLEALEARGCGVERVDTLPERRRSVEAIRDAMVAAVAKGRPVDLLVISGDGTLDHHVLVAAFWAFYPELVSAREGTIDCSAVSPEELAAIPEPYRKAFLDPLPDAGRLDPSEATIKQLWVLRAILEKALRNGATPERIARRAGLSASDPRLRLAVLSTFCPHKVVLRPHGFDLSDLAEAPLEASFRGLYPHLRSICFYPAGTAADNAVFAGVPGWGYAQAAWLLSRVPVLEPLRSWWERRVVRRFLRMFLSESLVAPARLSVVGFDGDWQAISSHGGGGPASGRFFTADLRGKTRNLLGYLLRIPTVILREGMLGSTVVRIVSRFADGRRKSFIEQHLAEGLFTNRALLAGVGSIPTTGPLSFAGQSSLLVLPPIVARADDGRITLNLRTLAVFGEAVFKGVLARALHLTGLSAGTLAGGGRFALLAPEHQVAIKAGEEIDVHYMTLSKHPRAVSIQMSGDPYQAWRLTIRSAWAPIPVLGNMSSLLVTTTREVLSALRLQLTYHLREAYIGGVRYFWHHMGDEWDGAFRARSGLFQPPRHLPPNLLFAQRRLLELWSAQGAGEFVDTTRSGLALDRRGRHAHNADQSAHLVVLREPNRGLLVRQLRSVPEEGLVYENRTRYRAAGLSHNIIHSQTLCWQGDGPPSIVTEDHFFRNAEEFQREAPSYFPLVGTTAPSREVLETPED
jgi:hypothetical protein